MADVDGGLPPNSLIDPPIEDSSGYRLRGSDLNFVDIDQPMFHRLTSQAAPLGMDDEQYEYFLRTLFDALDLDGIHECDIRIQGSSVKVFSGSHKQMPWLRGEIYDLYKKRRKAQPDEIELKRIERALFTQWPNHAMRPRNPLFDLLYRVDLDCSPSDYDIQLSSDEIDQRARESVARLGVPLADHRISDPDYNFIDKMVFEKEFYHLVIWASNCARFLKRSVTIAAFPSQGPPDRSAQIGDLSSHFKPSDWIISRLTGPEFPE